MSASSSFALVSSGEGENRGQAESLSNPGQRTKSYARLFHVLLRIGKQVPAHFPDALINDYQFCRHPTDFVQETFPALDQVT